MRVDAGFADTITNTKPVLRLDQTGTHALQNAPVITIAHPSGQNSGTLASESFADGGYDTIGRPGGLFNPNNYDTRAELDAKIAAIASTHGYSENIVPNAGNDSTEYTSLRRLQIGTEIYDIDDSVSINGTPVLDPVFRDNSDSDGIHWEVNSDGEIEANIRHLPGAIYSDSANYDTGDTADFNGVLYISLTNQSGHAPIDGTVGSVDNNVYHGPGGVPAGTIPGTYRWRITKAGVTVGTFDPDAAEGTIAETDLIVAESLHFNEDQFVLDTNLDNGNENISINPDLLGGSGQTAAQVQTAITGRLDDGDGTAENADNAYTTTEADRQLRRNTIAAYFAGVGIYLSDTAVEQDASSLSADEYYTNVQIRIPGGTTITIAHAYFFDATRADANDNSWRETDSLTGTLLGYQGG